MLNFCEDIYLYYARVESEASREYISPHQNTTLKLVVQSKKQSCSDTLV